MKLEKKLLDLEKKIRSMSNSRESTETVSQILGSALQARFSRQPEERFE
jgi:chaperonin cofactor prefoldin